MKTQAMIEIMALLPPRRAASFNHAPYPTWREGRRSHPCVPWTGSLSLIVSSPLKNCEERLNKGEDIGIGSLNIWHWENANQNKPRCSFQPQKALCPSPQSIA